MNSFFDPCYFYEACNAYDERWVDEDGSSKIDRFLD